MSNFSYVIDSSFQPFSMQEMLVPFTAYKDAFEKTEEQYNTLSDNADKFKYLSENLPEGSKARQLYEGYANDLRTQAEDLAHNGLTMGNRRALTSMKRRYQGEIGRIVQADEAMKEEKKLRQTLNAQDSSRLYATDNLSIDDFLDGNNPNLYSVSGNELYTRGAAAGKAASSRVFSAGDAGSTLNGYYRDYVQKMGYSAETIRKFYQDMSAIPELQMAADAILEERGVNQNLTGVNLQRARQSVINGMIDGAIYSETHNPQRDLGVLTKAEEADQNLKAWSAGASIDSNGNVYGDTNNVNYKAKDIANQAAEAQFNIMFPIAKEDIKDEDGNVITKAGERILGESYKINKGGKVVKANSQEDDTVSAKEKALVALPSTSLDDPKGFYVTDTDNNTRVHYRYVASVISNSDGTKYKSKDFITGKDKIYGRRVLSDVEMNRLPTALWEKIINTVQEKSNTVQEKSNTVQEKSSEAQNLPEFRVVECINKKGEKHYSIAIITN